MLSTQYDYDIDTYYKRNKVISNTNNQRNEEVQVNSRSLNVHKEAKSSLSLSDHGEEDKNNNNEIKKHFIDIKDIKSIHSGNTNTNIKEVNRNQIEKEILSDNPKKEENIFEQNLMNAPVMQSFQKRKEENQENINQLKDELMNPEIAKRSGFDIISQMTYCDLITEYFNSIEFERSIERLKMENESEEYIREYCLKAKHYVKFFYE